MGQSGSQTPDDFLLAALRDERLARHAVSVRPAWLWSSDGLRILWTNAVGAAMSGARNSTELARIARGPADRSGRQVARLAGQLVPDMGMRLERLRDFGAPLGGLATCACARLTFAGEDCILIAGIETPLRTMPFEQRLARLIEDTGLPLAVFAADGAFVAASPMASDLANGACALADFGGKLATMRLGEGSDVAFAALVTERARPAGASAAQAQITPAPIVATEASPQASAPLPRSLAFDPNSEEAIRNTLDMPTMDPDSLIEQYLSEEDFIDEAVATEQFLGRAADHFDEMHDDGMHQDETQDDETYGGLTDDDIFDETAAIDWPQAAQQRQATTGPARAEIPAAPAHAPTSGRPLRFVWQTDADGRFSVSTDEFNRLIGASAAAQFGQSWADLAQAQNLDPQGAIARALTSRETWTGLRASWPAAGTTTRLATELSGIALFGPDRQFQGFRGFGICRDDTAIAELTALRASATPASPPVSAEPKDASHADISKDNSMTVPPPNERDEPPALVSPSANVVPLRPDMRAPVLTPVENNAFNEIARQLSERLEAQAANDAAPLPAGEENDETAAMPAPQGERGLNERPAAEAPAVLATPARASAVQERTLLERMPFGVLVYRLDRLLFANPAFLERTGYKTLHDLTEAGGLDALYVEPGVASTSSTSNGGTPLRVAATEADPMPSDARLMSVSWDSEDALALMLLPPSTTGAEAAVTAAPVAESAPRAMATEQPGETGRTDSERADSELAQARREATRAATAKADLLARISHDIRAPLSAITGFADVMIEQRFGPLGNERYVEYMKDIRASGERVVSIIDDMLDLTQIESGQVALAFAAHQLNPLIEQCVAALQPQANRERIIIRSSLAKSLPPVVADARSLRQIATMLIATAIRVSRPGAQIIVSTALQDNGEVALRLRDAGHVMSESEITSIMDPLGSSPRENGDGASLDLSMARALIAANRARLQIRSTPQSGTLIEVVFSQASAAGSASSQLR